MFQVKVNGQWFDNVELYTTDLAFVAEEFKDKMRDGSHVANVLPVICELVCKAVIGPHYDKDPNFFDADWDYDFISNMHDVVKASCILTVRWNSMPYMSTHAVEITVMPA